MCSILILFFFKKKFTNIVELFFVIFLLPIVNQRMTRESCLLLVQNCKLKNCAIVVGLHVSFLGIID